MENQSVAQSEPTPAMSFDEEIGDHIPGLVGEFVTLLPSQNSFPLMASDSRKSQLSRGGEWISRNLLQSLLWIYLVGFLSEITRYNCQF